MAITTHDLTMDFNMHRAEADLLLSDVQSNLDRLLRLTAID